MAPPADDAYRLALQHHQAGRLADAESAYRQALGANSQHAGALHGLGTLALQADEAEMAEKLISRAIAINGPWPEACYHLGVALQAREQYDSAIAAYRRATALNPNLFDALYQLAVCLQLSGQRDKSIDAYRQAIALRGDHPYALNNFAIALRAAGHVDEAIATLRQAVAIKPDLAEAFVQLGMALREAGRLEDAINAFATATQLKSKNQLAWTNLAAALRELGRIDDAIAAQRQAVALRPDDAESNWALGTLLLLNGNTAEGAPLLEWRWKRQTLPWPRRRFRQPLWNGSDLAGRTIYLHAEQSNSDAIQFSRYIPMVAERGGKIVIECQPALRRLLENSFAAGWFSPGEPAPAFDVYCPLLSLRYVLGSTPAKVPYLTVPAEVAQTWKGRFDSDPAVLKVGLAWAGSPSEIEDRRRSISLEEFAPLRNIARVHYFSLQKGRAAAQVRPGEMADFMSDVSDFADTAGLVDQLDLVISVDTAVAHLAGALGKPVWTLLPFVPHWRWGLVEETTPWYPTMRLFRQTRRGDWADVVRRVAEALSSLSRRAKEK
jgi:tetratricopeptide (TPR) repeat protein